MGRHRPETGVTMKIAMIGTGYVGLVSGVCFSDFGHDVICVDKNPEKIALLQAGEVPIFEPGLHELMAKNVAAGRLSFTLDLADAVAGADAVFIAVGTPTRRGDGHADLSYVHAAAEEIAGLIEGFTVIVTKSTVPVGTSRKLKTFVQDRAGHDRRYAIDATKIHTHTSMYTPSGIDCEKRKLVMTRKKPR